MPDLSPEVMQGIITKMIILILSIAVHEFGHAIVADWLGDRLPRQQGRVTLNPIAHADPIGTLALPVFGLLLTGGASIGFGWGKPVMVNPVSFDRRFRMRTAHMLVAAAGPAMNILFAIVISLVLWVLMKTSVLTGSSDGQIRLMVAIHSAILMNFVLAFFNLIPSPPLDGGTVIQGLLPDRLLPAYREFAQYGIFILAALIMIPRLSNVFFWPAAKLYTLWAHGVLGIV
jgi:Zn-dependent protease